jgi:hypothetical protein
VLLFGAAPDCELYPKVNPNTASFLQGQLAGVVEIEVK